MAIVNPQTWEGQFKVVETKEGSNVFTLKPQAGAKYNAENLMEAIKAILAAKVNLDGWKVWLDGDFDTKLDKGEAVTPAKRAKIVKESDHIQLAFVKRPFPQPKLRFVKGEGSAPARATAKVREL